MEKEKEKERDKKRRFWDLRQSKKERELRERGWPGSRWRETDLSPRNQRPRRKSKEKRQAKEQSQDSFIFLNAYCAFLLL